MESMEWTVSFLPEQQIVVIKTHGVADETGSLEMAKRIAKIMFEHKATRLLIDHSDIQSVSGTTIKMYYRPQELHASGIPVQIKIAEIVFPEHKEHFDFLETVFRNRGFDFSIFADRESAIQWLTK